MRRKIFCVAMFVALLCGRVFASVSIDADNFPDEAFRSYVQSELDLDGDGIFSDDEIAVVTDIDVIRSGISSLKGIEFFTELETLECGGNSLAELDVPDSLTTYSDFGTQYIRG